MERRLFAIQRLSALSMAPFVFTHIGVIIYAVRGGLTAEEILIRTTGNWFWILFYALFVVAVSLHVPIGLRNIFYEWFKLKKEIATLMAIAVGVILLVLGLRAVLIVGGIGQ